jgi:hypothetical protein
MRITPDNWLVYDPLHESGYAPENRHSITSDRMSGLIRVFRNWCGVQWPVSEQALGVSGHKRPPAPVETVEVFWLSPLPGAKGDCAAETSGADRIDRVNKRRSALS